MKLVDYHYLQAKIKTSIYCVRRLLKSYGEIIDMNGSKRSARYEKSKVDKIAEDYISTKTPKKPTEWDRVDIAAHFKISPSHSNKICKKPNFPKSHRYYVSNNRPTRLWYIEEIKGLKASDFTGYTNGRTYKPIPKAVIVFDGETAAVINLMAAMSRHKMRHDGRVVRPSEPRKTEIIRLEGVL